MIWIPVTPPRLIRMYADRWQINWQESGIPDPQAQTVVDIFSAFARSLRPLSRSRFKMATTLERASFANLKYGGAT